MAMGVGVGKNGGKLEGMCEWLYVCVCVRVKQYPEALQ